MKFMILVKADKNSEAGRMPDEKLLTEMGKYNEELAKAGITLAAEGLHPTSKGARVVRQWRRNRNSPGARGRGLWRSVYSRTQRAGGTRSRANGRERKSLGEFHPHNLNSSLIIMCRNIKTLHNFAPPATEEEIRSSSLQFVRKLSGFTKPSKVNEDAFNRAVDQVTLAAQKLLDSLVTNAPPRNRETEAVKARERSIKRFGAALVTMMAGHSHN